MELWGANRSGGQGKALYAWKKKRNLKKRNVNNKNAKKKNAESKNAKKKNVKKKCKKNYVKKKNEKNQIFVLCTPGGPGIAGRASFTITEGLLGGGVNVCRGCYRLSSLQHFLAASSM